MLPIENVLNLIGLLESLLSFFFNSCIVVIHIKSFKQKLKMMPSDLIQLLMGVTNLSLRGTMLVNCIGKYWTIYYRSNIAHTILVLMPFHLYFKFWLIAWLSTHYWTSITSLKHQIFVWVKRSLSSFMPHLILLSAFLSLAVALPSVWNLQVGLSGQNSTISYHLNGFNFVSLAIATICLSFSIILVSLIITVSSLLRHVWNIKQKGSGPSRPNIQAHVSAVRTLILLLLLSATISTADLIIFMPPPESLKSLTPIAWMILDVFPLLEAFVIIQSSPKLRKMILQMFRAGKLVGNDNKDLSKE